MRYISHTLKRRALKDVCRLNSPVSTQAKHKRLPQTAVYFSFTLQLGLVRLYFVFLRQRLEEEGIHRKKSVYVHKRK